MQTEEDIAMTMHKFEDNIAMYKAIADKTKECLEDARSEAEKSKDRATKREAALPKTIDEQTTQLCDAENKTTATITSLQDIAAAQITSLNKELSEMQAR